MYSQSTVWTKRDRNPLTLRANANPGAKCCKIQNAKKVTQNTPLYTLFFAFCEHFHVFRSKGITSLEMNLSSRTIFECFQRRLGSPSLCTRRHLFNTRWRITRLKILKKLLWVYGINFFKNILFMDEKILTKEQKFNEQNDKVYAQTSYKAEAKVPRIQGGHHTSSVTVWWEVSLNYRVTFDLFTFSFLSVLVVHGYMIEGCSNCDVYCCRRCLTPLPLFVWIATTTSSGWTPPPPLPRLILCSCAGIM